MLQIQTPGTITDETAWKLGEIRIHVKLAAEHTFTFSNSAALSLRIVGDATEGIKIGNEVRHLWTPAAGNNQSFKLTAGDYYLYVGNKYAVTYWGWDVPAGSSADVDGGDWGYATGLTRWTWSNTTWYGVPCDLGDFFPVAFTEFISRNDNNVPTLLGDVSVLSAFNPTNFSVVRQSISGNIEAFAGWSNCTTLSLPLCNLLTGDVASLVGLTSLTSLLITSPSITGTIESLADGLWAAGRHSGSISVTLPASVTYNGSPITTSAHTLTFTSDPSNKWTFV